MSDDLRPETTPEDSQQPAEWKDGEAPQDLQANDDLRQLLADPHVTKLPWLLSRGKVTKAEGPHRAIQTQYGDVPALAGRDADAALIVAAVNALPGLLDRLELLEAAAPLVSAYYAYHSEGGSEVCPCDVCEKARPYFAALLRAMDAESTALSRLASTEVGS